MLPTWEARSLGWCIIIMGDRRGYGLGGSWGQWNGNRSSREKEEMTLQDSGDDILA